MKSILVFFFSLNFM